jgi:LysM repeat protein
MTASTRWRGLLAALLLALATIGLPLALAATAGDPLHAWPSLTSGQLSDTDMIAVLTAVFWLAWISFVIPVAIETATAVAARATHRPPRQVRLPLLGAQQHAARHLIGAVLLLLPATTSTIASTALPAVHPVARVATTAWSTAEPTDTHGRPTAHDPGREHRRDDQPTYRIPDMGGMRSYWALAEHYLGDGTRWREIWQLNEGRIHTDGTVMDSPRQLHAGWTILLPPATTANGTSDPPASTHDIRVAPGDTLSGLAAADGIRDWQAAWQLNDDRHEPDAQRYTDPDLIRPGWTLTLPGAPTRLPDTATSTAHHDHGTTVTGDPRQVQPPAPSRASSVPTATPPASEKADPPATTPAAAALPSRATTNDNSQGGERHQFPAVPLEIGLAAAAAVAALDRARRIAQRRRRAGHRPLPPPPELVEIEARIRRDAHRTHPTIAAIELATALTGTHPVTVHSVIARSDGDVDLHLTEETPPPPPFLAITGGWRLPAGADAFTFAVDPDVVDDPCPALIPLGATIDGQVLVNVAATGPVGITGDPAVVDGYLRQIVEALAGAPWATRVQLHLPPRMAEQLPSFDRLTVEDSLRPQPAATPSSPGDLPAGEEPGWRTSPIHLYVGWSAQAELVPLLQAAADPQRHVHFLGNGEHPATVPWTLHGDQLAVPGLIEPITVTLAAPVSPDTSDLLHYTATAPEVPVGDPRLPDLTPSVISVSGDDPRVARVEQPSRLLLLGPVELAGAGRLRRSQVLNLLTFLALHPRGVDRHQLLAALWPEQAPSLQTMRNRISETRRLLDGGITDGPIWRLTDKVSTDWAQFTALAAGDIDEQRRALQLVRGRPFTGLDDADWIDLEGIRSEVEAAIVDVALTVTTHDLDTANYPGALDAARAGLAASRYEERLHRAAIRAATAQGLRGVARTLQHEMRIALDLDIEPDDQIEPETLALLSEIRDRRPVTSDTSGR